MSSAKSPESTSHGEFKYLPAPKHNVVPVDVPVTQEEMTEKMSRKLKDNPFIPLGCFATTGILVYGLIQMQRGNAAKSQTMMRARVIVQGLTVAAMLGGALYMAPPITSGKKDDHHAGKSDDHHHAGKSDDHHHPAAKKDDHHPGKKADHH